MSEHFVETNQRALSHIDQWLTTEPDQGKESMSGYIGTPELRKIVYVESLGIDKLTDVVSHWHDQEASPEAGEILKAMYEASSALCKVHSLLCEQEGLELKAVPAERYVTSEFSRSFEAGQRYAENPNIFKRAKELEVGD